MVSSSLFPPYLAEEWPLLLLWVVLLYFVLLVSALDFRQLSTELKQMALTLLLLLMASIPIVADAMVVRKGQELMRIP